MAILKHISQGRVVAGFTIERVPMPVNRRGPEISPLRQAVAILEIGESLLATVDPSAKERWRIRGITKSVTVGTTKKFSIRKTNEGWRVYRTQ